MAVSTSLQSTNNKYNRDINSRAMNTPFHGVTLLVIVLQYMYLVIGILIPFTQSHENKYTGRPMRGTIEIFISHFCYAIHQSAGGVEL